MNSNLGNNVMSGKIKIKANSFFERHLTEIKSEGWSAFVRKLKNFIMRFIGFILPILFVPFVLLVRIVRPLAWIRFGFIRSDVIGNSALYLEHYLSKKDLEKSNTLDLFYFVTTPTPNKQWALMARRNIYIHPIYKYFDQANKMLPGGDKYQVRTIPESANSCAIRKTILRTEGSHLKFSEEENIRGWKFLQEVGLQKEDRFICLIVRDTSYKGNHQKLHGKDWSYHNYRDSDIDTYTQAALALVEKGYWVFRMGKGNHKPFSAQHSKIVDYANSHYSDDFLDCWLAANCHFMISSGTGLDTVAFVYRRPTVFVNFISLGSFNSLWNVIVAPKHLLWKSNGIMLTAKEYLKHHFYTSDEFEQVGIVIQDMTAMEIQDAVLEMESRLSVTWDDTFEDMELQNRFRKRLQEWDRFGQYHDEIFPESRIGTVFLRHHPKWLC